LDYGSKPSLGLDFSNASNQNPNKRCVLVARQRADDECIGAIATKTFICLAIKSQVVTILMRQNILQYCFKYVIMFHIKFILKEIR